MFASRAEERRFDRTIREWSTKRLTEYLSKLREDGLIDQAHIIEAILLERESQSHSKEGF